MNVTTQYRLATRPWTEYFPWTPTDLPPKCGDKAALKRVLKDAEIEKEGAYQLLKGEAQ